MSIIVQKFGGTSVADVIKIQNIVDIVVNARKSGNKIVVVVSAMAGTTNKLANYCMSISSLDNPEKLSEYDVALTSGEIATSALLSLALQNRGIKAKSMLSWQIPITTDDQFSKSLVTDIRSDKLMNYIDDDIIPVIAGFQGVTKNGDLTTLGRGGSDTTACAVAASLKAERCDIYTDVDGIFSADPRLVNNASKIDVMSYEEMLEFASMGAKVLHTRAVQIGMRYNIPIRVLSSFSNKEGTIITNYNSIMEKSKITGITHNKNIASIRINNIDPFLLLTLSSNNVNIDVIEYQKDKTIIIIPLSDLSIAKPLLPEQEDIEISTDIAFVSVIGFGIKNDSTTMVTILSVFKENNIEISKMISSEVKISLLIADDKTEKAVKALHSAFALGNWN